jgi:hypothetical protein
MSLWSWFTRRRLSLDEQDFQDEIRSHLAMAADERAADGADPKAARQASLREFGNVTQMTEAAREVWRPGWVETLRDLLADARYAVRSLSKRRGFCITVGGVLTLGIGLNAAVFTTLKGIALSPVAGVDGSARLLFGVSATDAASFATAFGVVLAGVLLATLIPAWRASRTDPLEALRRT